MPIGHLKDMLKTAQAGRYGVAAFNMIDYNSVRAIVGGAQEMDAPIIVQLSTKTIRLWGFKPIAQWVHGLAADADVPVALHLDHCTDVDVIRRCIDAGWTSVMFDGSALPFAENVRQSRAVYDITQAANVGLEAELGAIGGVEDDKFVAEDASILANPEECLAFCRELPELAVFAPAIGTAHGFYAGEPKISYDLLKYVTDNVTIPIALHGGTGLTDAQFDRCIALGCAKVNISTMHKKKFIDGFVHVARDNPKASEPIPFIDGQFKAMKADVVAMIATFGSARRPAPRWPPEPAVGITIMQALLFDCDGVLADTERDGHRVAFNRAFAERGLSAEWSVERYEDLLRTAGGKERMRRFFDEDGWPVEEPARDALIADLHRIKTSSFMEIVESGQIPLRAGVARLIDEARAAGMRVAVCSTSNERSVQAIVNQLGAERASAIALFTGDIVPAKKPDPAIYLLAAKTFGLDPSQCVAIEDSSIGSRAAIAAGMPCIVTISSFTGAEDFTGAAKIVSELGDPPSVQVTLADCRAACAAAVK